VKLTTFELRFEDNSGTALSTAEAQALVENLHIYLDTGSGTFEEGSDTLVTTFAKGTFSLTAGVQSFTLPDGDGNMQYAHGSSNRYFVVVELTSDASQQTPSHIRITHLTEASRTADDPTNNSALTLEFADEVTSSSTMPLIVRLALFEATAQADAIQINWQTVSELDNLGFNLYRAEVTGTSEVPVTWTTQLNSQLIPGQAPGSGQGAAYEWLDEQLEAGSSYVYWLEDVDVNGNTSLHAPVSATASTPTAVSLQEFQTDEDSSGILGLMMAMLGMIGVALRRFWRHG
jgi:hypothetical protein